MTFMQTQARICPVCCDDHFEDQSCNPVKAQIHSMNVQTHAISDKDKIKVLKDQLTEAQAKLARAMPEELAHRMVGDLEVCLNNLHSCECEVVDAGGVQSCQYCCTKMTLLAYQGWLSSQQGKL